jgi:hypothetical protein
MKYVSDKSAPGDGAASPAEVYAQRLAELNARQRRERRDARTFGFVKLAVASAALIAAGFFIHQLSALAWLALPLIVFVILSVRQEQLLHAIEIRDRAIRFYERGQARLQARWAGGGPTGDRFLDPAHPYARDLDIFGDASLFQFLNTARTQTGEETLARWLLEAAPPEEIRLRQDAVRDLAGRLAFRVKLWSAGEPVRAGVRPAALAEWGERGPLLSSLATRTATTALGLLWLLGLAFWARTGWPAPALVISVLNFAYSHLLLVRLERAAGAIERAADDLRLLSGVLVRVERESFASARLTRMQQELHRRGVAPCAAIRRLARIVALIQSRHSLFLRPLDWFTFWSAQLVFLAETWQKRFGPALRGWISAVGEMESLASLASFAWEHSDYAFAELVEEGPLFEAEQLAHPLLPAGTAIGNDLVLDSARQLMILSGPNMSGKSTFIRSIGVNAVLAQCGAPARALRLRISPLRVTASICILDSLSGGVSRFYAEIRRLKAIAEFAEGNLPVLFLLDELLSGTNSHDRFIGTAFVLRMLVDRHAIGIASTHDLALAEIPNSMTGHAFNAHFADRLEGDSLIFDFKLKPGVVETSNALKLMRAIGLGVTE